MFACELAGVIPDIITLSKALTGGTMALAATVARKHVFDAFLSDDPKAALMHGRLLWATHSPAPLPVRHSNFSAINPDWRRCGRSQKSCSGNGEMPGFTLRARCPCPGGDWRR